MVLMFVGNTSCIFSIFWEDALEGGMRPFGKTIDSEISKQSLEDGSGFDYEMTFMEYRKRDLPVHVARFSQIRVKGDSAYYQTNCKKNGLIVMKMLGRLKLTLCVRLMILANGFCWIPKKLLSLKN